MITIILNVCIVLQYDVSLTNDGLSDDGKYELNSNLTHYIIVRDGTVSKTGMNELISQLLTSVTSIGGHSNAKSNNLIIVNV